MTLQRSTLYKSICVLFPVLVALTIAEVRARHANDEAWTVDDLARSNREKKLPYVFDAALGWRPETGGPRRFVPFGAHPGQAVQSPSRRPARLLFLGDSATARGRIIAQLEWFHVEGEYEYCNAGVEGYDTCQVVEWYRRLHAQQDPDHVILTFHNNDFHVMPVIEARGGYLTIYSAAEPWRVWLPWPVRNSAFVRRQLVKFWVGQRWRDGERRVEQSLAQLKQLVEDGQAELSIVLLPILAPLEEWSAKELESRRRSLAIFERLGLRYFDLLPALEAALADAIDPCEAPGDTWHPGDAVSVYFARQLESQGLLPTSSGSSPAPAVHVAEGTAPAADAGDRTAR